MSRPTLVLHAVPTPANVGSKDAARRPSPRIGFIVSGALGNAVTRNRVKRRLRHLAAAQVTDPAGIDPTGMDIVVHALPQAATNPGEVPADFGSAWREVVSRLAARRPEGGAR